MDFSQLTLHQAKRQEMESQVRVLELESELDKERKKLMELRKTHYTLAGESEGWEQEVSMVYTKGIFKPEGTPRAQTSAKAAKYPHVVTSHIN